MRGLRFSVFCVFLVLFCSGCNSDKLSQKYSTAEVVRNNYSTVDDRIKRGFEKSESGFLVETSGVVVKILQDDLTGSRHQKFIVRLSNNHTVLISHNIDLALRVENLFEGDRVSFFGEYAWNNKGGVVHWTHKDPEKKHADGWVMHHGKKYW